MSKKGNWIPMDKNLIQEFATINREFSLIEAMFSYSVDRDKKVVGSIAGYAKQWNWTRNRVRRFLENINSANGHLADRKRTGSGHPIQFIDGGLWSKSDRERTGSGQGADPTNKPSNPKPKERDNTFLPYLESKLTNGFKPYKEKIIEFYNYRMNKPKAKQYQTEVGINGLFRDITACQKQNLPINTCLDIAMEKNWQAPLPKYYKDMNLEQQPETIRVECPNDSV